MFASNEKEMEHLVQNHQWDKISRKLEGADVQTKLAFATACGSSSDEEAPNLLINLLKDNDENVQLEAVKSLGTVGSENAKTHLVWLYGKLPDGKDTIREAIQESIAKINKRK